MKIVDANLLLYAVNADAPLHTRTKAWLEDLLSGTEAVGFEWTAILAFLRLSTRPRVFATPLSVGESFEVLNRWLAQPCSEIVAPTPRHAQVLEDLLEPIGTGGNLTTDAHLAAVTIEHGAELCSCDGDFARFSGLRYTNPLAS